MKHRLVIGLCGGLLAAGGLHGQDPAKEKIGTIRTEVIFGTGDARSVSGRKVLDEAEQNRLRQSPNIPGYRHYLRMGRDEQPVFRGYQNWASPLANSDAIMVAFQPQGRVGSSKLRLDLELWQQKKLVLRTDPVVERGKRVFILGPRWRDGRLIIMVELVELTP